MIKLPKIGNKRTSSRRKGLSSSKHHKFKLPKVKLPKILKKSKEASKEVTKGKSQGNIPFFKKIRNIRIVRGITLFIVFSIAAMLIVGVTGYIKLGNISSNSKKIYSENLVPIVTLGDLRSNIANMCSDVTKIVYNGYSAEAETEINGCDSRIRDLINQYKIQVKTMESTEKDAITRLENDYSSYMNAWNLVKSKVESGQKVTEDEEKAFNTISNNMTTGIDGMISYKKSISEKLQKDNQSLSSSSLTIMSITIAAAVILLLFLSIFLISVIKGSMKEIIKDIDLVAEGDLTVNIDTSSSNEFGIMKKELDKTVKKISGMINLIKESAASLGEQSEALAEVSEEMTASTQEIVSSVHQVASGSNTQAEDLANISSTVEDFGRKLDIISESVGDINKKSNGIDEMATQSNSSLQLLVSSIQSMGGSFNEVVNKISALGDNISHINDITNLIKSIADQTNLLALNAAIEAARAGEAGRGFAVVADEIRKLAEQSKNSSTKINDLVSGIMVEADAAINTSNDVNSELNGKVEIIEGSIVSFREINKSITDIIPNIRKTSELLAEIIKEKNNITSMVGTASAVAEETSATSQEIAQSTQEMGASSEEVASTAQILNETTKKMIEGVNTFKI